jgi:putative transposase
MPDYRRAYRPGGTFFFTLVTEDRARILCEEPARKILHRAIAECALTRPFMLEAMVLLPEHLHALMTLPPGDSDYSTRWAFIKARFTHEWLESGGAERPRTGSRIFNRRRGVWQRHFWEHLIRDPRDFEHHVDYIHYNPVKHEHVTCPHAWEYSSFHQWAARNSYEPDWCCACDGNLVVPPSFSDLDEIAMEMGE